MTDTPAPTPQPTPDTTAPAQPPRASWTITVLMLLGAAITLLGIVCLLMGLGGSTVLDIKVGDTTLKTTSVATVITAVGLVMGLGPLKLVPDGVRRSEQCSAGSRIRGLSARLEALRLFAAY